MDGNDGKKRDHDKKSVAPYEVEAAAIREKTARLKALRMARDAASPPPPPKPAKKAAASSKSGTSRGKKVASKGLADWLDDQKQGGHRD